MDITIRIFDELFILILLSSIPYAWLVRQKMLAIKIAAAGFCAWSVSVYAKSIFATTRPYLALDIPAKVNRPPIDGAFPSAHTAVACAISMQLFLYNPKIGIGAFIIAGLVGMMRIVGLVHYPVDILGGIFVGLASGLTIQVIHVTISRFKRSKNQT